MLTAEYLKYGMCFVTSGIFVINSFSMTYVGLFLVVLITLSNISILAYRLKYIKPAGIAIWGIYLILDLTFMGVVTLIHHLIFPEMPIKESTFLYENLFMIIQMGLVILVFKNFYTIKQEYLLGVFIVFLVVWVTELATLDTEVKKTLRLTAVFSRTLIVLGVWLYLFQKFKASTYKITEVPFFWIALGWLIYFGITGAMFIPEIAKQASVVEKEALGNLHLAAEGVSRLLYAIGFWKTKNWVIQHHTEA